MNFIFDIGNVLIDFQPTLFLRKIFSEQLYVDKINKIIFNSPEWEKLDQGFITHKEASDIFCLREPDLQPEILHTM